MRPEIDLIGETTYKRFTISYQVISIKIWYSAIAKLELDNTSMKTVELDASYQTYTQARGYIIKLAKEWIDNYIELNTLR